VAKKAARTPHEARPSRAPDSPNPEAARQSWWQDLDPPLAIEEWDALQVLAGRKAWDVRLESPHVGVWEVERLDRRGWLAAQDVKALPGEQLPLKYSPYGDWYRPTLKRRTDGRSEWPSILTRLKYANRTPQSHIDAQIALTIEGRRAATEIPAHAAWTPGVLEALARALERISGEWRRGDAELLRWTVLGMSSGGFETVMSPREGERQPLRLQVEALRTRLVPAAAVYLDAHLRDELRRMVADLDPEDIGTSRSGDRDLRWRLSWDALYYQGRIEYLAASLRAMAASKVSPPSAPFTPTQTHPAASSAPATSSNPPQFWTKKALLQLCAAIGAGNVSASTFDRLRAAAGVPASRRGSRRAVFTAKQIAQMLECAVEHTPIVAEILHKAWSPLLLNSADR
jgi:hypothetical protein